MKELITILSEGASVLREHVSTLEAEVARLRKENTAMRAWMVEDLRVPGIRMTADSGRELLAKLDALREGKDGK